MARSGDAAVTVLLGVSRVSNDRRQEWHEIRRRDQNSRYSMFFTKTVLSDRIAEFQVKSLVALIRLGSCVLRRTAEHATICYASGHRDLVTISRAKDHSGERFRLPDRRIP